MLKICRKIRKHCEKLSGDRIENHRSKTHIIEQGVHFGASPANRGRSKGANSGQRGDENSGDLHFASFILRNCVVCSYVAFFDSASSEASDVLGNARWNQKVEFFILEDLGYVIFSRF